MKRVVLMVAFACIVSARVFAACPEPQSEPPLPDGATASREDMLVARKAFQTYDTAVREYAMCLEKSGGSEMTQNAVVNRLQLIATKFNAELRAFKKRNNG